MIVMTMLAKSFVNVQAVTPGFDASGVLSARLTLPAPRFSTREALIAFQRVMTDRLSALPGVTHWRDLVVAAERLARASAVYHRGRPDRA
jgi:hypothetical protein